MDYRSKASRTLNLAIRTALCAAAPLSASHADTAPEAGTSALEEITITGLPVHSSLPTSLGANSAGYGSKELEEQVNVIDTSDIVKYSPDTMTRKRYIGDRNAIIETRTASVTSSARSLVYVDGMLLSNLLGNSYSYPSRWNMVMPEEISRVDFFFGPFAAAYGGSSIGTTVLMTTRMPEKLTIAAKAQVFSESFDYLGHSDTYQGHSLSGMAGDHQGAFSWLVGFDRLESNGHPMTYALLGTAATTTGTKPACNAACQSGSPVTTGTVSYSDPSNVTQRAIGGQSLDHTVQDTVKLKLGYDGDGFRLRYMLGGWRNTSDNHAASWLADPTGATVNYSPTGYVNIGGSYYSLGTSFAENHWHQQHWMQGLTLSGGEQKPLQWEISGSAYRIAPDNQWQSVPQGTKVGTATYYGQLARNPYGDGWAVLDARGLWREPGSTHTLAFGAHHDRYQLDSRTDYTTTGNNGSWNGSTTSLLLKSASAGVTTTDAAYLQDSWRPRDRLQATVGLRGEHWRAMEGRNTALVSGVASTAQYADRSVSKLSPKLWLEYEADADWALRGAVGKAYRFPTVTELFQAITLGSSLTTNNPDLKPEVATTVELTASRNLQAGKFRISVFQESMADALYSQTTPFTLADGSKTNLTAISNIDLVRTRGAELAVQKANLLGNHLDLTGNLTYSDAVTLRDATNPAYEGKVYPGVPRWRATAVATYRPIESGSLALGIRHSGRQYNTLANTDMNPDTYSSNSRYTVVDLRWMQDFGHGWKGALGIDNLFDRTYFAYHPMSQRTIHAEIKFRL